MATRRPRRASHQSVGPMAAPRSLKEADPFQVQPGKLPGPKDLSLAQVDDQPDTIKTEGQGRKEGAHRWSGACANAVVKVESADVEPRRKGLLSVPPSILDGRVNGQSKEGRTKGVALLNSTGRKSP